jgi:NAD(P)-dependent dehydrogenase (short-subunit alcohol dehydrogenase family)
VLRVNLTGTYYIVREAARAMIERGRGCMVMITSSVGRRGRARWGAYAVSKFGIEGLTQVLADELRPTGISVFSFNPGGARTAMRAAAYPEENPLTVRDPAIAAEGLLRLVTRDTLQFSGQAIDLGDVVP